MRRLVIIAIIVIFLAAFGVAVAQKENQLANGRVVILAIAPVDPFSLMQGYYMTLDFALAGDISRALANNRYERVLLPRYGTAIIALDEKNIGHFVRFDDGGPLAPNELMLRFKLRKGMVLLASGAFFFQEGHAEIYESAQYGELRLDSHGRPLIANLLNNDLEVINAPIVNNDYRAPL